MTCRPISLVISKRPSRRPVARQCQCVAGEKQPGTKVDCVQSCIAGRKEITCSADDIHQACKVMATQSPSPAERLRRCALIASHQAKVACRCAEWVSKYHFTGAGRREIHSQTQSKWPAMKCRRRAARRPGAHQRYWRRCPRQIHSGNMSRR